MKSMLCPQSLKSDTFSSGSNIKNIKIFQREINDLEVKTPIIVAFGKDAYTILTKNFKNIYWIIKIPHYSNYTSKEKYREEVRYILQF